MRTMYDSTNPTAIPTNAQLVAGYVPPSGFTWPPSAWNRFPNSVHVRITPSVATTGLGINVLDVEPGNATPAQAPGWAATQRRLGQIPTIYCSAAVWGTLQQAFASAGVPQPEYWVAAYPGGGPVLPTLNGITAVAHQYADPATSGGDYDLSVVADFWPGVDGAPDVNLTDALPDPLSVVNTGTVEESLTTLLGGVAGRRNGGVLSNQIAGIAAAQASLASAINALTSMVAADNATGRATMQQQAADHAAAMAAIVRLSAIDPAALEPDLHNALTSLGWTPPPTAQNGATSDATTAPAVLAVIESQLSTGAAAQ